MNSMMINRMRPRPLHLLGWLAAGALAPAFAAPAGAQTHSPEHHGATEPSATENEAVGHDAANHHERPYAQILIDQLEYRARDGNDAIGWDGQAWYGGDYNKIWLKTQGEYGISEPTEHAEVQLLYSRLLTYNYDLQAGVRYDLRPDPSRAYGVIGLQGLAPGYFEIDLQGFVSNQGHISARFEAEYDLLITQRLVLQPKFETNLAIQDDRRRGIGSGIDDIELGLRLRYEIMREVAPYIGISYERALGESADFARDENEGVEDLWFVAGLRLAF